MGEFSISATTGVVATVAVFATATITGTAESDHPERLAATPTGTSIARNATYLGINPRDCGTGDGAAAETVPDGEAR